MLKYGFITGLVIFTLLFLARTKHSEAIINLLVNIFYRRIPSKVLHRNMLILTALLIFRCYPIDLWGSNGFDCDRADAIQPWAKDETALGEWDLFPWISGKRLPGPQNASELTLPRVLSFEASDRWDNLSMGLGFGAPSGKRGASAS